MAEFSKADVLLLPHAEKYRDHYRITIEEILLVLNKPDDCAVVDDHYSAIKVCGERQILLDYYLTLPLQGDGNRFYAIVDYVGSEPIGALANLPN